MTKVKICGNCSVKDALLAAKLGADYLGFIVEVGFSKDSIGRKEAAEIIRKLPKRAKAVLVTYLTNPKEIAKVAKAINAQIVQLHNPKVSADCIKKIKKEIPKIKIAKTVHVGPNALAKAKRFAKFADYILLDTKSKGKLGGTGITHDWGISRKIVKSINKKVFLAGGLNPENVKGAIRIVKPYAVDTNSGVKLRDKKKDVKKLKKFIKNSKTR